MEINQSNYQATPYIQLQVMLFLLVIIGVVSFLFSILHNLRNHGKYNLPPGPKGIPLIGNLHQFDPSTPHLYFSELAKIYGPIFSLRFGNRLAVVIQSANLAKEVLKTQDLNFCSRPFLTGQRRLSYNGSDVVFAPYNERFRELKKLCVVHLFSSKKVQSSYSIRREEVSRMMERISSLSSASKVINLSQLVSDLSSNIICRLALGRRYEEESIGRSKFLNLLNEAQAMFAAFYFSDYFPVVGSVIDKLTGLSSRLEHVFQELDQFYTEILNDHLDSNKPKSEHEDFVDVVLQLKKERHFSFELTLDYIKGVLMNILIAGTDTSAAMVVWAMTELMKNPNTMRKVQNEIRSAFKDKTFIEEVDLPKLEYFKAVVKETFRLHPAAPLLVFHEALQKCTIQGYDIPEKAIVVVSAWANGRDPLSWRDPESFIPERFLGNSINFTGQDFELIPFGAGRRICPGMSMGIAALELAIANLLHSFDWMLPLGMTKEDIDCDVIPGITMHKKNQLCLMVKIRAHET